MSVAALVVPQSMSYARLAGLPSIIGLYGAFVPVLCYAALGSSRHLVRSPPNPSLTLAGLPSIIGLHGAFVPVLCYAALGSSRHLVRSLHLNLYPVSKPSSRHPVGCRALLRQGSAHVTIVALKGSARSCRYVLIIWLCHMYIQLVLRWAGSIVRRSMYGGWSSA